jgi:hypothetical protein
MCVQANSSYFHVRLLPIDNELYIVRLGRTMVQQNAMDRQEMPDFPRRTHPHVGARAHTHYYHTILKPQCYAETEGQFFASVAVHCNKRNSTKRGDSFILLKILFLHINLIFRVSRSYLSLVNELHINVMYFGNTHILQIMDSFLFVGNQCVRLY